MADLETVRYSPTLPTKRRVERIEELEDILSWIDEEFRNIFLNLEGLSEGYSISNAPPDKLRVGMVRYADGTNWNPDGVNGEGLYVYKSTGWSYLG